jgi:hypothetical protein
MSEGTITERLMEPFPPEAIKEREGGGHRRLSYVEGHTVIHRLIKATGNRFDVRVLALEYKGDLLTATVALSIPELGTRQHIGVQKVSEKGGEDLVKGAVTDAIKKAATLFGVGLELYGPDYESAEQDTPRAGTTPGREPAPRRAAAAPGPTRDRPAAVPSAAGTPSPDNGKRVPTFAEARQYALDETISAKARHRAATLALELAGSLDELADTYSKVMALPEREGLQEAYEARHKALKELEAAPF